MRLIAGVLSYSVLVAALLLLAGCTRDRKTEPEDAKPGRPTQAPEKFRVRFDTSQGPFVIEAVREWAPRGADRFYELASEGFFDETRFFRVVPGFVVQFGIHRDPKISGFWRQLQIADDPVTQSNTRGSVTFAKRGPNTRTTQIFINLANNSRLDATGFSPFGKVIDGIEIVDRFYGGYGDTPPRGGGPDQKKIEEFGNAYLERGYSKLDYVKTAKVEAQQ